MDARTVCRVRQKQLNMRLFATWLIFLFSFLTICENAKILGVFPTPSFSHQIVYRPIWQELVLRGHELTVITPNPTRNSSLNLKEIDISDAYKLWTFENISTISSQMGAFQEVIQLYNMMDKVTKFLLEHDEVQNLIHRRNNETFDLVIVEYLLPRIFPFATIFDCPYVGVLSSIAPFYAHQFMGNPVNPSLYPDYLLRTAPPLTFFQRCVSLVLRTFMEILVDISLYKEEAVARKYFGVDLSNFRDIAKNVSLILSNTNPILEGVRPLCPNTIEFGGGIHLTPRKKLPEDLQVFLDNTEHGVIYLSFGSNIKSESIDPNVMKMLIETFKKLNNYKFLCKFEEDISDLPENVKVIKWAPQQDILRHKNIILFITHGGLLSVEEAIFFHVPILVMPFCTDLYGRADLIKKKGLGLVMDKTKSTSEILVKNILEVIHNSTYKTSMKRLAALMSDQPMIGVEKAVWWIEYVIRHKGAHELRGMAANMPFYQYHLLDIFGFMFLILIFCFVSIKIILNIIKGLIIKKAMKFKEC